MAAKPKASKPAAKPAARPDSQKTVDGYVAGLTGWQAQVVNDLRTLIKQTAPAVTESLKWAQPVYEHHGPLVWIKAHRAHVNFGFWRGAQMSDPLGLLEGDGDRMRHVKITGPQDVRKKEFQRLVREAIKLNETHGNPTKRIRRASA